MSDPCQQEKVIDLIFKGIDRVEKTIETNRLESHSRFTIIEDKLDRLNSFKLKIIGGGIVAGSVVSLVAKFLLP